MIDFGLSFNMSFNLKQIVETLLYFFELKCCLVAYN